MQNRWQTYVEPLLRAVRPLLRPLERTALFAWAREHVRRLRSRPVRLPPRPGAPRRLTLGELGPAYDLARDNPVEPGGTAWRATGIDPQLVADCNLRRGWARIELQLEADVPARVELYVDTGRGFNRFERFELSELDRQVSFSGFVRLPRRVRRVRLDPLDRAGRLVLTRCSIAYVTPTTFWRVSFERWRASNKLLEQLRSNGLRNVLQDVADECTVGRLSESTAYARWRTRHALTPRRRRTLEERVGSLGLRPTISVIVPVYNAPLSYLRRCLDSVRTQIYPHWELCIADDASPDPAVRRELEYYARRDSRIKVAFRATNGNISAASNSALALATGEYVALLDNDDELEPHALALAALFINADPHVDVLYSDEDKVDTRGHHFDPFFKPDWSPEYFLSGMYLGHLGIYRRALVESVGRFRSAFDGSQDYDLALRVTARTAHIRHIPDVLYHWRTLPTSTAASTTAKPAAYDAARRALTAALSERGVSATVEHGQSPGYYRPRIALAGAPHVTIVVPQPTSSAPPRTSYPNVEVIRVGRDVSCPPTASWAERANLGAQAAHGEILVFVGPALVARSSDWLNEIVTLAQLPDIGVVGAKTYDRSGRLAHVGLLLLDGVVRTPYLGFPGNYPGYNCTNLIVRNWSAVRDVCLATRRDVWTQVGGFDPADGAHADVGYCLRVRTPRLRVAWTPYAELVDAGRAAEHERLTAPEVQQRLRTQLPFDPYYNPNLAPIGPLFRVDPRPATVLL